MRRDRSTDRKRIANRVGKVRSESRGRLVGAPVSSKGEAAMHERAQRGSERMDQFVAHQDDDVLCPQARTNLRAFAEWAGMLERNAYLRGLFPGEIALWEEERVAARIQRHFPEVTREDLDKMHPGQMAEYLKLVWEAEQWQSGNALTNLQDDDALLDHLAVILKPQANRIVTFLWGRKFSTTYGLIAEHCWPKGTASDETVTRALRHLANVFNENSELGITIEISHKKQRARLIRPQDKLRNDNPPSSVKTAADRDLVC